MNFSIGEIFSGFPVLCCWFVCFFDDRSVLLVQKTPLVKDFFRSPTVAVGRKQKVDVFY